METNIFGNRLRILLEEKDLEGKEFAKIIHVQPPTVSNWLNGNRFPNQDTLRKIADYFNVSVDYLLGRTDIRNINQMSGRTNRTELTPEEKYPEVHDVEEAMKIILEQPGLMLKGEILSDESKIILANAIQMGLRTAEELEKKKNKGDGNE